jgi:pimeloyl-ACP methyl ester carboxylesterase
MRINKSAVLLLSTFLLTSCAGEPAHETEADQAQQALGFRGPVTRPSIVLVHGAFADGTGWQRVITRLQFKGYPVTAVQNPLTSLSDDITTTKRVIDAESAKGPVIVVGHPYGGAVMTGAAAGNPDVKALVYIDAFAPASKEPLGELLHTFGPVPLDGALAPDAAGFLYIDRTSFHDVFCADLGTSEARVLAAVQKPVSSVAFGEFVNDAAWQEIPSCYLLGEDDLVIPPDLQRFMADRTGARVREIASSHASLLSHLRAVVNLIEDAVLTTED